MAVNNISIMKIKRSTVNLPADLLKQATEATGLGITDTIITGLELVKKGTAYKTAMSLKGKLNLQIDLNKSRERSRS